MTYELHFAPKYNRITDKVKLDGIAMNTRDDQGNPVTVPVSLPDNDHVVGGRSSLSTVEFRKARAALATIARAIGALVASGQGSFAPSGSIKIKRSPRDGTMRSPHAFRVAISGFQVDGAERETLLLQWLFEACTVLERVDKVVDGEVKKVVVKVDNEAGFHRYSKGVKPKDWYGLHQTKDDSLFHQDDPFADESVLLEYWLDHGFPT